jgi:chromosomal replication initiation ATPase DnaA
MKSLESIATAVFEQTGITIEQLREKDRRFNIALARHLFMYLGWKEQHRWSVIGHYLDLDHSSCIHGATRIDTEMRRGERITVLVRETTQRLEREPDVPTHRKYRAKLAKVAHYGFVTLA